MIYVVRSCPLNGLVSHSVEPLVFFGPPSILPMSMPHVSLDLHVLIQRAPQDNSYSAGTSSEQVVPVPLGESQQPIPPKASYGYITSTGRCLHRARCKHLRGFHKPLTFCDCIPQSTCPTMQLFADTEDRVHVSSCDVKYSTRKCLTWCKDCW